VTEPVAVRDGDWEGDSEALTNAVGDGVIEVSLPGEMDMVGVGDDVWDMVGEGEDVWDMVGEGEDDWELISTTVHVKSKRGIRKSFKLEKSATPDTNVVLPTVDDVWASCSSFQASPMPTPRMYTPSSCFISELMESARSTSAVEYSPSVINTTMWGTSERPRSANSFLAFLRPVDGDVPWKSCGMAQAPPS
jgi:hypothetical protein